MLFNDRLFIRKTVLLAGDLALCFLALFLALSTRHFGLVAPELYRLNLGVFLPIFAISIVVYFLFDLYSLRLLQAIYRSVYYLFIAIILNGLLATAILYTFFPQAEVAPKMVLAIYSLLVFLLTIVWRFLYHDLFFANARYLKNALILGSGKIGPELRELAAPPRGVDYRIVGFVAADDETTASPFPDILFLGHFHDLQQIIRTHKIDEVIVAFDYRQDLHSIRELSDALTLGVKIFEWPVFYEQVFQKVPTNEIDHFWFIYAFGETDKKLYERLKRVADVVISAIGIVGMVVILPLVAVLVKLSSRGPVFFRQKRVGLGGKIFTLVKFRTMQIDAEKDGATWAVPGDKRATAAGRFLRRTRLDELPQFTNILWGDMSLVGPRPERPEFLPDLDAKIPFYYKRQMVKPGLTGFAQVMYPYAATVADSLEKVGYDLFYIKNRSLFLYAKIVLLTLRTMLTMGGR